MFVQALVMLAATALKAETTDDSAKFFGYMGIASALVFASKFISIFDYHKDLGASYGTAKSGVGIASMGVLKPDLIFKSTVPIIMAGILGIYGLIVSVILISKGKYLVYSLHSY